MQQFNFCLLYVRVAQLKEPECHVHILIHCEVRVHLLRKSSWRELDNVSRFEVLLINVPIIPKLICFVVI